MESADRLSAEDWIQRGLKSLELKGPKALKAEPLAVELGVSRGSFYWHFKNVRDYHRAVLEAWEQSAVEAPYDRTLELGEDDPVQALERLIASSMKVRVGLESAVLSWASDDAPAAEAVQRVNRRRMELLAGLLLQAGVSAEVAQARAAILCAVYLGRTRLSDSPLGQQAVRELVAAFVRR